MQSIDAGQSPVAIEDGCLVPALSQQQTFVLPQQQISVLSQHKTAERFGVILEGNKNDFDPF